VTPICSVISGPIVEVLPTTKPPESQSQTDNREKFVSVPWTAAADASELETNFGGRRQDRTICPNGPTWLRTRYRRIGAGRCSMCFECISSRHATNRDKAMTCTDDKDRKQETDQEMR